MPKILVSGGFPDGKEIPADMQEFAREVGRQLIVQKHTLLNGCFNELDRLVAEGALGQIKTDAKLDTNKLVQSWVLAGHEPAHRIGQLQKSKFASWDPGEGPQVFPEPIAQAEAVILIGGGRGTYRTASFARLAGKPLLPVTTFGGAAAMIFDSVYGHYPVSSSGNVSQDDFGILNAFQPSDLSAFAKDVVSLAGRLVSGTSAFIIMSFRPESDDTYGVIKRVCADFGYAYNRIDKTNHTERIYSKIAEGIHNAAFVIADVTYPSVNVYYELGYAEALRKVLIVVAKEGTTLPFDTRDLPTIMWPDQTRLEERLRSKIEEITGRTPQRSAV